MKLFAVISLFLISCAPVMASYTPAHNNSNNTVYNNNTTALSVYSLCTLYGLCMVGNTSLSVGDISFHAEQKREENVHRSLGRGFIKSYATKNSSNKGCDKRRYDRNSRHAGRNYHK